MTLDDIRENIDYDGANGCWVWKRHISKYGYGRVAYGPPKYEDGRAMQQGVHRIMYEAEVGPIPEGYEIDHLCRNRACCNPAHLEAVTRKENCHRGFSPSGINHRRAQCAQGHKFDEANTYIHKGRRYCRKCRAKRMKAYHQRGGD